LRRFQRASSPILPASPRYITIIGITTIGITIVIGITITDIGVTAGGATAIGIAGSNDGVTLMIA
jgi:hypothetical protein